MFTWCIPRIYDPKLYNYFNSCNFIQPAHTMQGHDACGASAFRIHANTLGSKSQQGKQPDIVQHSCMCGPRLNVVLLCDNLFWYFLCHPYILTIFVENFYCSLVSALFVEHKLRNTVYIGLTATHA